MNKISPTAAGQSKANAHAGELIDTINQVFALFRVNFHNQYYAAIPTEQVLAQTKKLWIESLRRFQPNTILTAAKKIIEESEYLPTLHKMIEYCRGDNSDYGLPDVRQAYLEACHATSPKSNYSWSHPAVYFAGRDSDWFFLASNTETQTYPVFKENYLRWCDKVKAGEKLPPVEQKKLPENISKPLDKAANKKQLRKLRESLQI